ncbi:MAG TPA: tail sheath stabilizer and completion protein [Candidatus Glassbacteria bacterium]|nr:tail sheath stabilizer and completion protein [Candidatus Glassbacteria bacterium]
MIGPTFYHALIKKYVVLFGTLFNNISINRSNGSNDFAQSTKVPLSYGPKEKFLANIESLIGDRDPRAIFLPRMGFELSQMTYAPMRKLGTTRKIHSVENVDGINVNNVVWNPVPYDMYFELFIAAKSIEDGTKILEQILPYFTPEWTVTAKLLDQMPDYSIDIPLILQSITVEDNYDASFENRRSLVWTIGFMMKGYMYGSIAEQKIIKLANVNFLSETNTV